MRFSTLMPLLLAAGVAHAQFGQGKGQGKGQGGQGGQGQGGQGGQGQGQGAQGQGQNGQGQNGQNGQNNNNNNNANANALALDPANVQTNSQNDGLADAEEGQAASATDDANFINFCTGETLTNGLQVKQGSCNGIPMGKIPATDKMVSAVMIDPVNNDFKQENTPLTFSVKINNLQAGTFTNPDNTYYAAPQDLQGGTIVGHTHITVQDMNGQKNPTEPLDAQDFAFFKGINDAGDGNGLLSADLAEGLPAGEYRVCSMTSASNHQPVLMPVAQRGAQDDCVRFTVNAAGADDGAGAGGNGQGGNGQGGNGQGQQGQGKGQQGQGKGQAGQQGQGQQGAAQGQQGAAQGQQGAGAGAGAAFGQGKGQGGFGQGKGQGGFGQAQGQQGQGAQAGGRRGRKNRFASRHYVA